jgi:NAD(P)-dependent dehydrogenase (short-subunit alcohol dehydrogenase family)
MGSRVPRFGSATRMTGRKKRGANEPDRSCGGERHHYRRRSRPREMAAGHRNLLDRRVQLLLRRARRCSAMITRVSSTSPRPSARWVIGTVGLFRLKAYPRPALADGGARVIGLTISLGEQLSGTRLRINSVIPTRRSDRDFCPDDPGPDRLHAVEVPEGQLVLVDEIVALWRGTQPVTEARTTTFP